MPVCPGGRQVYRIGVTISLVIQLPVLLSSSHSYLIARLLPTVRCTCSAYTHPRKLQSPFPNRAGLSSLLKIPFTI